MGWKVYYIAHDGKPSASPVFGSESLANAYARTVKGGKVVPTDTNAPSVEVQQCPDGRTVNAMRAADQDAASRAELSERMAEASFEAGSQARLYGASVSEALDEARYAASKVSTGPERLCAGGCGRTVLRGFTICRICSRI